MRTELSERLGIDAAFATLAQLHVDALVVADPLFDSRSAHVVSLAARYAVPAIYISRKYVADGGLISYGAIFTAAYHLVGSYAGKILNGAKPADLPVQQSTKFELVVNLNTAKALGVERSHLYKKCQQLGIDLAKEKKGEG